MVNADRLSSPAERTPESEQSLDHSESQILGQKVKKIIDHFANTKAGQERYQESLRYENQLSTIFSGEQMRHYQEICDDKTFNEIISKTLLCAQVEFQEGQELTAYTRIFPKNPMDGYTPEEEKIFRYTLITIGAERTGADLNTAAGREDILSYLRHALIDRGYHYYAYNSADEASIRENGLSPEGGAPDVLAQKKVFQIMQKYNDNPALGFMPVEQDDSSEMVKVVTGPERVYTHSRSYPEWFARFVDRGRRYSSQENPYICRDYDRTREQIEHYCDTLSSITYGDADTERLIESQPMTDDDRAEIMGIFDTMWNRYGDGTPKVALIPNSAFNLDHQQARADFYRRQKSEAPLNEKVGALLRSCTNDDSRIYDSVHPSQIKFVQLPAYHQAAPESQPETGPSIDSETLWNIIYENGDAAKELLQLGDDLSKIRGIEEVDIRALQYQSKIKELKTDFEENRWKEYEKNRSLGKSRAAGFREYYEKYFSILDQLSNVRPLRRNILGSNEQEDTLRLREALASALVETDVSEKDLARINGILSDYSIPNLAKEFLTAEIIYPPEEYGRHDGYRWWDSVRDSTWNFVNRHGFRSYSRHLSEAFQEKGGDGVRKIIYHDLLKCALESNAENVLRFLDTIQRGEEVVFKIVNGEQAYSLPTEEFGLAIRMKYILSRLWQQTKAGRAESQDSPGPLLADESLKYYYDKFRPTKRHSLADRIVRSYCWPEHIGSAEELRQTISERHLIANQDGHVMAMGIREYNQANHLSIGSLVKAIPNPNALESILENGILSKEFVANGIKSDATPFDTDFSLVIKTGDLRTALTYTDAAKLTSLRDEESTADEGLFLVIERDAIDAELDWTNADNSDYRPRDYEIYYRDEYMSLDDAAFLGIDGGAGDSLPDVGIRTGLPSSKISYIVAVDQKSAHEAKSAVRRNGFYIPIVNLDGKLIYTPEDYDGSN